VGYATENTEEMDIYRTVSQNLQDIHPMSCKCFTAQYWRRKTEICHEHYNLLWLFILMCLQWPTVILRNGFMCGEWIYQKEMPTIMIFLHLQEHQKQVLLIWLKMRSKSKKCKTKFWVESKVFNKTGVVKCNTWNIVLRKWTAPFQQACKNRIW